MEPVSADAVLLGDCGLVVGVEVNLDVVDISVVEVLELELLIK